MVTTFFSCVFPHDLSHFVAFGLWIAGCASQHTVVKRRHPSGVVLHDRPAESEHVAAGVLSFDQGSDVRIRAIPNDGSPITVVFEPRTVGKMTLQVVDGIGTPMGLSEIYLKVQFAPDGGEPPVASGGMC